eukprot:scaffold7202_cov110-Isochrysis_galbana.AAC.7
MASLLEPMEAPAAVPTLHAPAPWVVLLAAAPGGATPESQTGKPICTSDGRLAPVGSAAGPSPIPTGTLSTTAPASMLRGTGLPMLFPGASAPKGVG